MKFTDEDLRSALAEGVHPAEIARRFGVSRAAVSGRVKRLAHSTAAALHAPAESERFAAATLALSEELHLMAERARLMSDACDRWLRDPHNDEQYEVGPRAHEVDVVYTVVVDHRSDGSPITETRKAPLSVLLGLVGKIDDETVLQQVEKGEFRHADPRELILKVSHEWRGILRQATDALAMLADARRIEDFQHALLECLGSVEPDVAERIADALQRRLILRGYRPDIAALPAGVDDDAMDAVCWAADAGV